MSFYDQNEQISFPLVGNDDNQIPEDLLVDCIVHAPSSLGSTLSILSISVTNLVVSLVLGIDGTPVAYLTSLKELLPIHQALPITGILPGVSGFIAFGEGVNRHLLRLDGVYEMEAGSLISFIYDTSTPTVTAGGHEFFGLVKLVGANGIKITGETLDIKVASGVLQTTRSALFGTTPFNGLQFNVSKLQGGSVVTTVAAVFSADDPDMLNDPIPGCLRAVDGTPQVQPITSINGVRPDCNGELTIQIVNVQELSTSPTITADTVARGILLKDDGSPCE